MAYTLPFPDSGPTLGKNGDTNSSPYNWSSLITNTAVPLGSKILGDKFAPGADLISAQNGQMNAQTNQKNAAFNQGMALNQLGRQNEVNSARLPGMYETLGYSPDQAASMTRQYGSVPTPQQTLGTPASGSNPLVFSGKLGLGSDPSSGGTPGVGSNIAKTALGLAVPSLISHAGTIAGAIGGIGAMGAATLGIGAAAGIGALLWKKSQVHPTADKWVQGEQNPFDQSMANIDKAGLPPDQVKQLKTQNAQNYLNELQAFSQKGGHENIVARQAAQTFRQYYGDPSQYGVNLGV